ADYVQEYTFPALCPDPDDIYQVYRTPEQGRDRGSNVAHRHPNSPRVVIGAAGGQDGHRRVGADEALPDRRSVAVTANGDD
ncbi:MAG: hypothetical protein WD830_01700, partial [Chloroflexota bacterium]